MLVIHNVTVVTWPRSARSLAAHLLRLCLGQSWDAARALGLRMNKTAQPETTQAEPAPVELGQPDLLLHDTARHYLVEYDSFPQALLPRFEAAVAQGGADTAAAFRLFASEDFSQYDNFARLWLTPEMAERHILVDAEALYADPRGWLLRTLPRLAPGLVLKPAQLARAERAAASWIAANPRPDLTQFRHYDALLFQRLAGFQLRRDVVMAQFRDLMGRNPGEKAIALFQTLPDRDHLRQNLLASKEYARQVARDQSGFDSYEREPAEVLMSPAFHRWERLHKNALRWPLSQVFVSPRARVIYCPIGKVACTFLKRQMVQISDVAHKALLHKHVHGLTDNIRTGLQLSDYPEATARGFIADPGFFKFAVLRAPRERLLSAYIEKFVQERSNLGNIHHTGPVIAAVQRRKGLAEPDPELGISFRDFITEITALPSHKLDPHWRPQVDYLAGIPYDRIFNVGQMDALIDLLEQRSGQSLSRQAENVTGSGAGIVQAGAADLLPAEIMALPKLDIASFFDPDLSALVASYFSADLALLATTLPAEPARTARQRA